MPKTAKQVSRIRLVQALYQWQLTQDNPAFIEEQFTNKPRSQDNMSKQYFRDIFQGLIKDLPIIQNKIALLIDRTPQELGLVENSILWLGSYELMYRLETPHQVILNEAIELAKSMAGEKSYKYINAILDKLVIEYRKNK